MHRLRACLCLMAVLLTAGTPCFPEELKIGAGAAPAEDILKPLLSAFEKSTKIPLIVVDSGPKIALTDLKRANLDAAAAGISFEGWLKLMAKEGTPIEDPSVFRPVCIGKDRIVVITHKDNPVKKLTAGQLSGIFSGEIDNWKEVGGEDAPIMIVWGTLTQDDNAVFKDRILAGKPLAADVLETPTAEEVRENVSANPTAIGIGPSGIIDDSVASPEIPDLYRDIVLVTRNNPPEPVKQLLSFISREGRTIIKPDTRNVDLFPNPQPCGAPNSL
jgi:phosphate transport system substrate-binding protein